MFLRWLLLVILSLLLTACASFRKSSNVGSSVFLSDRGVPYKYMFCEDSGLNYLITFPKDYDPEKQYPLIVYLHSMAERGTDLHKLIRNEVGQGNGISKYSLDGKLPQFITISPLCPDRVYWSFLTKRLNTLLSNITNNKNIDIERIYLTGVSMGGMGTWFICHGLPSLVCWDRSYKWRYLYTVHV
jgi:predicted peptidase